MVPNATGCVAVHQTGRAHSCEIKSGCLEHAISGWLVRNNCATNSPNQSCRIRSRTDFPSPGRSTLTPLIPTNRTTPAAATNATAQQRVHHEAPGPPGCHDYRYFRVRTYLCSGCRLPRQLSTRRRQPAVSPGQAAQLWPLAPRRGPSCAGPVRGAAQNPSATGLAGKSPLSVSHDGAKPLRASTRPRAALVDHRVGRFVVRCQSSIGSRSSSSSRESSPSSSSSSSSS